MVEDAKVDVILQRIEEDVGDEVEVIPSHIRRYGVNNIFQRTLSYLFGWTEADKPVKIRATAAGWLKVVTSGVGAFEHADREPGIAGAAKSNFIAFDSPVGKIDVIVQDYEMWLYTSVDGVAEEGAFRCLPNIRNIFEITCSHFKVQRADVNDVEFEVVGVR